MPNLPHASLPDALLTAVRQQTAVLFLGAGASVGATHPQNIPIPTTDVLRDRLADEFLGGELKHRDLPHVAEMCISETDLFAVQSFVRRMFLPFGPAPHHLIIPRFRWHALVTTNYDLIVESAYGQAPNSLQTPVPFTKDGQPLDTRLRTTFNAVRFLKLHGSIDQIDDRSAPLLLSKEQYILYGERRQRLFSMLADLAYEHTFIFSGYSLNDQHIHARVLPAPDAGIVRPRHYLVTPHLTPVEERYWNSRRVTCIPATFEGFLSALDNAVPDHARSIPASFGGGDTTLRTFYRRAGVTESPALRHFLATDVDHVREGIPTAVTKADSFYKGVDTGWYAITADLDVRRKITDNILSDAILTEDTDRPRLVDLHVVKGPAGHGKTTTLRRVAWDAATHFEQLCLFFRPEGSVQVDPLLEIAEYTDRRLFLFVDHAALRVEELKTLIDNLTAARIPATVITAERDNEWNVRCGHLDSLVTREYPLRNLSVLEIDDLLKKLAYHRALGRLEDLTPDEQRREFLVRAERQLLVALHEATSGRPFEQIVSDEFARIIPPEAQTLYLDICTLNRLSVPVRAGLIARVSGIRFEQFREKLLLPLEHVVRSYRDPYLGDIMYAARHPHIAELVFQNELQDVERRFDQIMRILGGMNIDYSSDAKAFRALIRGREMASIFPPRELGQRIYSRVEELMGVHPHALQQHAIFEMEHPAGDLRRAEELASKAVSLASHDRSIRHTLANVKRKRAKEATNPLLREKYRIESLRFLRDDAGFTSKTRRDYHTLILVLCDRLEDLLVTQGESEEDALGQRRLVELVRDIESYVEDSQQRFPDEERLLTAEARFREILNDHDRAFAALQAAFDKNPRSEWIAMRMSRRLAEIGNLNGAKDVLMKCRAEKPNSKPISFALARFLMANGDGEERSRVLQLLRSSFSDGDTRFEAQYWYGRELWLRGRQREAEAVFASLGQAEMSPSTRNKVRGLIRDETGRVEQIMATIRKKEEAYLFASAEGFPRDVFCHAAQAPNDLWDQLRLGDRIRLEVGFSMRGPSAHVVGR